jgi:hypothetical protein
LFAHLLDRVDASQVHALFDLLGLEAEAFGRAVERADSATSVSGMLSWINVAIESAFACVELSGRLRDVDPERANANSNVWRDMVRDQIIAAHEIAEARREELSGRW